MTDSQPDRDYSRGVLSRKEFWAAIAGGLLLSAGAAFLFYRSVYALALAAIFIPLRLRQRRKDCVRLQKERLARQFQSGMQAAAGALAAGYSMENAWCSAQEEIGRLYGREAEFYVELSRMNQKIRMNEPMDRLLTEFARRSGIEDICNFAEIFCYARRSGGNMNEIIKRTVSRMQKKAAILAEIETAVAAKRAEQKMMNYLLPGVLLFITLSSPEYVSSLYKTVPGMLVMSVCLVGYILAVRWSEKIVDIQV